MERLEFKDEDGRKFLVEVPDGQQDMAESGIVIGPPDLRELEIMTDPVRFEIELHNQLYERRLFTLADVRRRPEGIGAALQQILKVDVLRIRHLYGR